MDMCVVVDLDDILIYSDNRGEHNNHVREVLMPRAGLIERREGMRSSGNHMSKPQRWNSVKEDELTVDRGGG